MSDDAHDPFLHDPQLFGRSMMKMHERIEQLEDALRRIADWGNAYPEDIFPEPDADYFKNAHRVLTAHAMSLDRLSAAGMRFAVRGCARVAREALKTCDEP